MLRVASSSLMGSSSEAKPRPRARRVLVLLAFTSSYLRSGLRAPLAFGLRTVLQDGLPTYSQSPGGSSSSFGSERPMAYPPLCLACNGLSRHILGRKLPPVFHDPLHAAQLWIVRAYRDRPTLTSRPPPAACSRAKGLAASAARTRLKAFVYRSQHSASEQSRKAAASTRKDGFSHARKGTLGKIKFYI